MDPSDVCFFMEMLFTYALEVNMQMYTILSMIIVVKDASYDHCWLTVLSTYVSQAQTLTIFNLLFGFRFFQKIWCK